MANRLQSELAGVAAELIEEIGIEVTWNSVTYSGILSDAALAVDMQNGGLVESGDFSLKLRKADLPSPGPAFAQTVTVDGLKYKIKGINPKPGSPWLHLTIER